jgi:predicted DsbA family dithiol-disulfide isomerase
MSDTQPLYLPTLQIYASIECPYAYLATYRLRQVASEYFGRVRLYWRALPLEYINQKVYPKPQLDQEREMFSQIEPELPFEPWPLEDWQWPTTFWPAFEALACAQAQGMEATLMYSWALRHAFFAEGRNISMRHELLAIAEQVAADGYMYFQRFQNEWDSGRWKNTIVKESWLGWREMQLPRSATLILPNGRRVSNPGLGEIDFDYEKGVLNSYTPVQGDPLDHYREIFEETARFHVG